MIGVGSDHEVDEPVVYCTITKRRKKKNKNSGLRTN